MKRLLLIVVPVLLLLGLFLIWWTQPQRVVARRLQSFLKAATVESGEGTLARQTRGQAIEKYLADRVLLDGPGGDEDDRTHASYKKEDISAGYSYLANSAKSITFQEPVIDRVTVDGDTAVIDCTINVSAEPMANGPQIATLTWTKTGDGWQLSKAQWKNAGKSTDH